MATDDNEEELLRSVALQNANSILLARQRAERELIATKEALERKTEELAHSLAMTSATLEATTDGILVTDANGELTGFNQNFVDLWRVPPEIMNERKHRQVLEMTGCRFGEPEKFRARIEEIYRDSPPKSFDLLELIDGTVIERHSKIQFVDERNVGRVWSFRDITERTRAEERVRVLNSDLESRVADRTRELRRTIVEREALQEQLLQAQKMESVGTLAGGIAHDFNNILNIIQGYAFIARAQDSQNKEAAESLTVIIQTTQRGSALVQQLLTVARKSEVKTESTDANGIVEALIKLVSQTFPRTIELSSNLEPNLPVIMSDGNQLGQALLNLCVNARDAMPGGGTLTVKTQAVDGASLPGELAEANVPRYVCIEISDTGIGMAESVRTRIFEPFFTTKKVGRGTGLGMAVVYGIVKNHNGFIDVQSKPMCGTTFRLYLPAARAGEKPAPEVTTEAALTTIDSAGCGRILVVEDESNMVSLLRKVLLRQGYQVVEATDGQTALDVYKREKDNIDAVLLDIGLPKKGGEDLLLQMKEHNPDVKVIVASGYIEPELKAHMKRIGIEHFIDKPYMPDEIIQALQNLLHGVKTH